jgi:phosphoribosylformimino-5-aminoimidazole carboxamide ribotide isomerase
MDVIPVIDVQHGRAVRAAGGVRAAYLPLATPLAESSDPVAIAHGFQALFAFPRLYIADLDGIEGRGRKAALPEQLAVALPGTELWVDAGASPRDAARLLAAPAIPVVGTESMRSDEDMAALAGLPRDGYVLSLDFAGDDFMGPPAVLADAAHWPDRIIVMTLARVGSGRGPDVSRLADTIGRAGSRSVYAAGGVRDRADVEVLRRAGAAGVLVARALHDQKITAGDLFEIAGC